MSVLRRLFSIVETFLGPFLAAVEIFKRIDVTRLNDDDRADLAACATEYREVGAAFIAFADTLDAAKAGGISAEEWANLALNLEEIGRQIADLPAATKNALD